MRQGVFQKSLGFLGSKPVVVQAADVQLTFDAGLLPIRQLDRCGGADRAVGSGAWGHAATDVG